MESINRYKKTADFLFLWNFYAVCLRIPLINAGVRAGLQEAGELSKKEQTKEIFLSQGWTRAEIKEAQYYQQGDVVRFGRDYQQLEASKGEYMRVDRTDAANHVVMLQKQDGSVIEWEPKKHNNVEVYRAENREIAEGDVIRMTRSQEPFKNGETARVIALKGDMATLEVKQGSTFSQHEMNLAMNRHWDYAYASTVHAAQGSTQYRSLFHIRTPENVHERQQEKELKSMAKVFGNRSFYVGTTRASHEMKIYTNNKQVALDVIAARQDKTSAVEVLGVDKADKQVGQGKFY